MKKKSLKQSMHENPHEMLEETSFRINKFIFKEVENTNGLNEALVVAGCVGGALLGLYVSLLGEESARSIFSEMSKAKLPNSPVIH